MVLEPGDRIGPYEVVAPIGSGGMGVVYRARDPRLGREVAIKVMGGPYREDPDRLQRFRAEVRTAGGLDHPNVLVVHDVGELDGAPYLVCELLEGQTLKARLDGGPLDRATALDIAVQIARGLTAVHRAGVVHRDLKPANLMLLAKGGVKILDFGVARPAAGARDGGLTATGAMIGTVAYMAPEQVRGETVDARTDLFALGAVIYEMVAGTKAFTAATDVELGYAILKTEPPPLEDPGIDAIVRRCLAKSPGDRYQSAHDLAYAIEALRAGTPLLPRRGRRWLTLVGALVLAACVGGAAAAGLRATLRHSGSDAPVAMPMSMTKLSSRIGIVGAARYAPDGRTVVYSAAWNGGPTAVYTAQPGVASAREIVPNAELLSVSSRGDIAVLVKTEEIPSPMAQVTRTGTLARTHLQGGALREVAVDIMDADWLPTGELVVARRLGGSFTTDYEPRVNIEWPLGSPATYTTPGGVTGIAALRATADGSRIAFIQYRDEDQGEIVVLDRTGQIRRLEATDRARRWHLRGLAWNADGSELLAGLGDAAGERCVYALSMTGERRVVQCAAGDLAVEDRASDGRLLVTSAHVDTRLRYSLPGSKIDRELALPHDAVLEDVTADGKRIVYAEPGGKGAVFLRDLDAAEPVRISDGVVSGGISPNGAWVGVARVEQLAGDRSPVRHHYFVPTGGGAERERVPYLGVKSMATAPSGWTADSASLLTACTAASGQETCAFGVGGTARAIDHNFVPNGSIRRAVSPDGKWFLASQDTSSLALVAADGADAMLDIPSTPAVNRLREHRSAAVIGWSTDGGAVFAAGDPLYGPELSVVRIDLESGEPTPWRRLQPDDRAGEIAMMRAFVIGDGAGYVYSYRRTQSDLYAVEPQSR